MAKILSTKTHSSGIALGGIGTGSVELLPDGEFHFWQIANQDRWAKVSWDNPVDNGENSTGALSFWVRTEKPGSPNTVVVRKLGMKTDPLDFTYRMFPWNKPVEAIEFDGKFPICDLTYQDGALPAAISLRAISPFVPNHSDRSATPGFYLDFTVENPTDEALTVSLLGTLEPSFVSGRRTVNRKVIDGETVRVVLDPMEKTDDPDHGSLCLAAQGGDVSCVTAESFRFLREFIPNTEFGVTQESLMFGFRETGTIPNSDAGSPPDVVPEDLSKLSDDEIDRLVAVLAAYPHGVSFLHRMVRLDPAFPSDRKQKESFLRYGGFTDQKVGSDFGSTALCNRIILQPGESRKLRFVLTWYFPNHRSSDGTLLGHYYENLFPDALAVSRYLTDHADSIADRAVAFSNLLYSSTAGELYSDAWSVHLSMLVKDSWWLKDGKFGLWEGLGYCGFHTTDITYHASFGLVALFPDLQLRQMRMGLPFQREDGRVHHFFTPDLDHVDDGFDRIDMNNQFVLMVCRDYLLTGDLDYLTQMWVPVQKAMDSIGALDSDGDGLPDTGTRRNTYDSWNFSGTPTYIAVLWLAALKAAIRIAEEMGDYTRRDAWSALLETGKSSLESRLWNGSYYQLWVSDDAVDGSLMTDQLDGEWFLRMMGLDGNLPDSRIRDVVRTIFTHNFDPDNGLINATCPDGTPTTLHTYHNCQADSVWTGINYVFCALALSVGLPEIADSVITTVHRNQMRLGYFWDHWECGHHYTRPMSSWTTLNALLGLKVDRNARRLSFSPLWDGLTLPLCFPGITGLVRFTENEAEISLLEGDLTDWCILCTGKSVILRRI